MQQESFPGRGTFHIFSFSPPSLVPSGKIRPPPRMPCASNEPPTKFADIYCMMIYPAKQLHPVAEFALPFGMLRRLNERIAQNRFEQFN